MLRDVPYCKSILACGMGGLIFSVVMLTWIYPSFLNRVSQVKETKVREYMQDRYGISDRSATILRTRSDADRELSKIDGSETTATMTINANAADDAADVAQDSDPDASRDTDPLPPAKRG